MLTDRERKLVEIGDHARALLLCINELPEDTDLPRHLWQGIYNMREGAKIICNSTVFRD